MTQTIAKVVTSAHPPRRPRPSLRELERQASLDREREWEAEVNAGARPPSWLGNPPLATRPPPPMAGPELTEAEQLARLRVAVATGRLPRDVGAGRWRADRGGPPWRTSWRSGTQASGGRRPDPRDALAKGPGHPDRPGRGSGGAALPVGPPAWWPRSCPRPRAAPQSATRAPVGP